jgi:hypothetical protein
MQQTKSVTRTRRHLLRRLCGVPLLVAALVLAGCDDTSNNAAPKQPGY